MDLKFIFGRLHISNLISCRFVLNSCASSGSQTERISNNLYHINFK